MRNPCTGRNAAWVVAGLVLVAITTPLAPAAERIVLGESFTATW